MAVIKSLFGKSAEGKEISLYTLSNDQGMKAEITDLGATLVRVLVPDATGKADDLVLGFDNGESYYGNDSFFGTVIGPCANRTGGAEYTLDGVTYQLDKMTVPTIYILISSWASIRDSGMRRWERTA